MPLAEMVICSKREKMWAMSRWRRRAESCCGLSSSPGAARAYCRPPKAMAMRRTSVLTSNFPLQQVMLPCRVTKVASVRWQGLRYCMSSYMVPPQATPRMSWGRMTRWM